MAQQTPAYVISAASHSAALFRQAFASQFGGNGQGVIGSTEYAVTQQASPNMSVQVAAGRCSIQGTNLTPPSGMLWTPQGNYFALNDAPATVTIAAADPTNPRIDVVYVQVQDAFYSGAANQAIIGVVTGTPSATPAVPATPANAIPLANVAVAANATSIVTANISDRRILVGETDNIALFTNEAAAGTQGIGTRAYLSNPTNAWGAGVYVSMGAGTWLPFNVHGPWKSWAATLSQTAAIATTVTYAKYSIVGKTVRGCLSLTAAAAGAVNAIGVNAPVAIAGNTTTSVGAFTFIPVGSGSSIRTAGDAIIQGSTFIFQASGQTNVLGSTPGYAIQSGDSIYVDFMYETP